MSDLFPITLEDMIHEAERELAVRERVYPDWIRQGKIREETGLRRIAIQRAIVARLKEQRDVAAARGDHDPHQPRADLV